MTFVIHQFLLRELFITPFLITMMWLAIKACFVGVLTSSNVNDLETQVVAYLVLVWIRHLKIVNYKFSSLSAEEFFKTKMRQIMNYY